jgi:hypothetical protein
MISDSAEPPNIEGTTRLIEELGEPGYIGALAEHRRLLRAAFAAHCGASPPTLREGEVVEEAAGTIESRVGCGASPASSGFARSPSSRRPR